MEKQHLYHKFISIVHYTMWALKCTSTPENSGFYCRNSYKTLTFMKLEISRAMIVTNVVGVRGEGQYKEKRVANCRRGSLTLQGNLFLIISS